MTNSIGPKELYYSPKQKHALDFVYHNQKLRTDDNSSISWFKAELNQGENEFLNGYDGKLNILMRVAKEANVTLLTYIVTHVNDSRVLNMRDKVGMTALMYATKAQAPLDKILTCIQVLLRAGADPHATYCSINQPFKLDARPTLSFETGNRVGDFLVWKLSGGEDVSDIQTAKPIRPVMDFNQTVFFGAEDSVSSSSAMVLFEENHYATDVSAQLAGLCELDASMSPPRELEFRFFSNPKILLESEKGALSKGVVSQLEDLIENCMSKGKSTWACLSQPEALDAIVPAICWKKARLVLLAGKSSTSDIATLLPELHMNICIQLSELFFEQISQSVPGELPTIDTDEDNNFDDLD